MKAVAKSLLRDSGKSVENRDAKNGGLSETVCANFLQSCANSWSERRLYADIGDFRPNLGAFMLILAVLP